jgi:parvulin-like peptidyl-prolyl isomerase
VTVDPEAVEKLLEEVAGGYPPDAFEESLLREYMSLDLFKKRLEKNLLIQKVTDLEMKSRIKPDPEAWAGFYQSRPKPAAPPKRVQVSHLSAKSRETVVDALVKVRRGYNFDRLARQLAEAGRIDRPPEPIWVYPPQLPGELAEALEGVDVGQVTDVVDLEDGYAILFVHAVEAALPPKPSRVMADLRREYMEERRRRAYRAWVDELKQAADIRINESALADFIQSGAKAEG